MGEPQDEISLRELYLIFKSGLRWIVGVSVAVAALAFVMVYLQPRSYEADAIAQVRPLPISTPPGSANVLDLRSVTDVTFETYQRIATSTKVLDQTLEAVSSAPRDLTVAKLAKNGSLVKLSTDQGSLTVEHRVTLGNPDLAARVADAWAKAATDGVRSMLASKVKIVSSNLGSQESALLATLQATEDRWATFQSSDDRSTIHAELNALDNQTASLQQRVLELNRQVARSKAQQQLLQSVIEARQQGQPVDVRTQLRALGDQGVLDTKEADALSIAIASLPKGTSLPAQDVATLIARTQLQQQTQDLAADAAELQTVQAQLRTFTQRGSELRQQLAALDQKAQDLQRTLEQARNAYNAIADIAPTADATNQLVPTLASVIATASVALEPTSRHTITITAVALVLTFFLMVLAVFLKAAVAGNDGSEGSGTRGRDWSGEEGKRREERSPDGSADSTGEQRAPATSWEHDQRQAAAQPGRPH